MCFVLFVSNSQFFLIVSLSTAVHEINVAEAEIQENTKKNNSSVLYGARNTIMNKTKQNKYLEYQFE
jgi:hypothetical protein